MQKYHSRASGGSSSSTPPRLYADRVAYVLIDMGSRVVITKMYYWQVDTAYWQKLLDEYNGLVFSDYRRLERYLTERKCKNVKYRDSTQQWK